MKQTFEVSMSTRTNSLMAISIFGFINLSVRRFCKYLGEKKKMLVTNIFLFFQQPFLHLKIQIQSFYFTLYYLISSFKGAVRVLQKKENFLVISISSIFIFVFPTHQLQIPYLFCAVYLLS